MIIMYSQVGEPLERVARECYLYKLVRDGLSEMMFEL